MKIQIKDLEGLVALAKQPFAEHTTLISASLGDIVGKLEDLDYKPENILDVNIERFISAYEADSSSGIYYSMEQAEEIAEFVKEYLDVTDVLICQSVPFIENDFAVAVAAAVEDYLLHDDGKLFLKNSCFNGYDCIYKMLKDTLAGITSNYGVLLKEKKDFDFLVEVDEVDTDEIV